MDFLILIALCAAIYFIIKLNKNHNDLKIRLIRLEQRLDQSEKTPDAPVKASPADPKTPRPAPTKTETVKPAPALAQATAEKTPLKTAPVSPTGIRLKQFEQSISTNWMVWLGGVAFALGGGFLVKHSIDTGLLSPAVRVSLGFIIGIVMTVGGELLRQRHLKLNWLQGAPDFLPSAISAAGLFTAFAATYASYALYGLLPPLLAFIILAALSFVSSGLAWYQGRFFAYLGLIGGILVPALVSTGSPSAWGLFPYLLIIIAANLWVSRQKAWSDVAATTLLLALFWVVVWIFTQWTSGDILPIGIYLLLLGGLNGALLSGASPHRATVATWDGMFGGHIISIISDMVSIITVILLVSIVRLDHYSATGFILLIVGLLAQAYALHRSPAQDLGGVISLAGVLFLFATWHVPTLMQFKASLPEFDQLNTAWAPTAPPDMLSFIFAALIFALLSSGLIFLRLPHLLRKNMWACLGNIIPVLMLIVTYWRIEDWGTSLQFAFTALILAAFCALAVNRLSTQNKGQDRAANLTAIAAYAAGATTALSLGIAMVLRDAWLSTALALQLVALSHIWRSLRVAGLRRLALILAAIVLVRLSLNNSIFDYGGDGALPAINWLFYGYALTAGFFAYAAHIFRLDGEQDRLMSVLRAGAILLATAFVTLEIRVLFSNSHHLLSDPTVLEAAVQTINWVATTTILFWFEVRNHDRLLGLLRRFMTLVGLFGMLIGGGLIGNVFVLSAKVGDMVIFNLQLLQYFIPGCLYAFKAYIAQKAGDKARSLYIYGTLAFLTFWYWASAEVHHYFHPGGGASLSSDWEWYAYSAVWLLYAILLLVAGLRFQHNKLRLAGLAVLGVVIFKVFLIDMDKLEGLARALSFLGLGGCLMGLGYLYQRLNLKPVPASPETQKT